MQVGGRTPITGGCVRLDGSRVDMDHNPNGGFFAPEAGVVIEIHTDHPYPYIGKDAPLVG